MTVKTQITFKDFWGFYLKGSLIRFFGFPIIAVLLFIFKGFLDGDEQDIFKNASIWLLVLWVFMTVRGYFSIKKAYYSDKKIQENISYTFVEDKIKTEGETFENDFHWNTVSRVKELKDWFLIYHSLQTMNMIPKKDFTKQEIVALRALIKNSGVKAKLRND